MDSSISWTTSSLRVSYFSLVVLGLFFWYLALWWYGLNPDGSTQIKEVSFFLTLYSITLVCIIFIEVKFNRQSFGVCRGCAYFFALVACIYHTLFFLSDDLYDIGLLEAFPGFNLFWMFTAFACFAPALFLTFIGTHPSFAAGRYVPALFAAVSSFTSLMYMAWRSGI